jgi:hypothetical protein
MPHGRDGVEADFWAGAVTVRWRAGSRGSETAGGARRTSRGSFGTVGLDLKAVLRMHERHAEALVRQPVDFQPDRIALALGAAASAGVP